MGTWHLEVIRMVLYITFPVGLFHWFNQPENFTEFVETAKKEHRLDDDPKLGKMFRDFVDDANRQNDLEALEAMETKYMN